MGDKGDKTTPNGDIPVTNTLTAPNATFKRSIPRILTDNLMQINRIGDVNQKGVKHPRYIQIQKNEIFNALIELYAIHFKSKMHLLKHLLDSYPPPPRTEPEILLARIYISHWFMDLYVSIRAAIRRHEIDWTSDPYIREVGVQSKVYDNFLIQLIHSIKPTHIKGLQEDTLYIPQICENPAFPRNLVNPFFIPNYTLKSDLFKALIRQMTDSDSGWLMSPIGSDAVGRPCWLFDWHEKQAYAWFPEEENYNKDDTNLAFILGVSCTPLQASRDNDVPQQYPDNIVPEANVKFDPPRKNPKRFHSMFDVRAIENISSSYTFEENVEVSGPSPDVLAARAAAQRLAIALPSAPSASRPTETGGQDKSKDSNVEMTEVPETHIVTVKHVFPINLFQIVDYKYYAKVIRLVDQNTRVAAHKILVFRD